MCKMCHIVYEFKLVLYFTGGLVLTELGENCKSRGMIPMDSMEDCKANTRFIQTYFSHVKFKSNRTALTAPGGCIFYYNTRHHKNYGEFNTYYNGTGHGSYRALCQPGEKFKKKVEYWVHSVLFFYLVLSIHNLSIYFLY